MGKYPQAVGRWSRGRGKSTQPDPGIEGLQKLHGAHHDTWGVSNTMVV
jgi:hypothetical protein